DRGDRSEWISRCDRGPRFVSRVVSIPDDGFGSESRANAARAPRATAQVIPLGRRVLWPFWNARERRLRAGLRIALHALGFVPFILLSFVILRWVPGPWRWSLLFAAETTGTVAITVVAAVVLDRRPPYDIGIRARPGYWLDLGFGVATGAICMGSIAGVE